MVTARDGVPFNVHVRDSFTNLYDLSGVIHGESSNRVRLVLTNAFRMPDGSGFWGGPGEATLPLDEWEGVEGVPSYLGDNYRVTRPGQN